jgi:transposase-like protein
MNTTSESAAIPETLLEAVRHFSDLDVSHEYLVRLKWPDGRITCPKCGGDHVGHIKTRRMFQCRVKDCRKQFSAKVGTIFEDSPLGLDKWFVAVWSIAAAKNGISSHEVGRALGVTQKTAWFMLHRVRLAMQTQSFNKMGGIIEGDETMIGGKAKFMHAKRRKEKIKGRGGMGKAIVQGLLERGGEVRCVVVPNQKTGTLQANVRKHVARGSHVYTDALASYVGLDADYVHQMIDHAKAYVEGMVHTNGMENFWSLLKRCLKGTYVAVAPYHLFRYLDEETFRFNKRKGNDGTRFVDAMMGVVGKRLQYSDLIAESAD